MRIVPGLALSCLLLTAVAVQAQQGSSLLKKQPTSASLGKQPTTTGSPSPYDSSPYQTQQGITSSDNPYAKGGLYDPYRDQNQPITHTMSGLQTTPLPSSSRPRVLLQSQCSNSASGPGQGGGKLSHGVGNGGQVGQGGLNSAPGIQSGSGNAPVASTLSSGCSGPGLNADTLNRMNDPNLNDFRSLNRMNGRQQGMSGNGPTAAGMQQKKMQGLQTLP